MTPILYRPQCVKQCLVISNFLLADISSIAGPSADTVMTTNDKTALCYDLFLSLSSIFISVLLWSSQAWVAPPIKTIKLSHKAKSYSFPPLIKLMAMSAVEAIMYKHATVRPDLFLSWIWMFCWYATWRNNEQEVLGECRPLPCLIWGMWNLLVSHETVYPQIFQNVPCYLSLTFHGNPFMHFSAMLLTDRWGQTEQMDGQTERQTERQTDTE